MRIHYAYAPETGSWFIGSSLGDPNAVNAMIERLALVGYQTTSVDVMDNSWRMVKAAIDNRNNLIQMDYLASKAVEANKSVTQVSNPATPLVDRTVLSHPTGISGADVAGMPPGSVLNSDRINNAVVKAGDERAEKPVVKPATQLTNEEKDALLKEAEITEATQPLSVKAAANQVGKEAGRELSAKEKIALRKAEVKGK